MDNIVQATEEQLWTWWREIGGTHTGFGVHGPTNIHKNCEGCKRWATHAMIRLLESN